MVTQQIPKYPAIFLEHQVNRSNLGTLQFFLFVEKLVAAGITAIFLIRSAFQGLIAAKAVGKRICHFEMFYASNIKRVYTGIHGFTRVS